MFYKQYFNDYQNDGTLCLKILERTIDMKSFTDRTAAETTDFCSMPNGITQMHLF